MPEKFFLLNHAYRAAETMAIPARRLIYSRKLKGKQSEV